MDQQSLPPNDRPLNTQELRAGKPNRHEFLALPRTPIHLVLDGLNSASNLGNVMRIADALRAERVWLCASRVNLDGYKYRTAGKSMDKWVPLTVACDTLEVVRTLRGQGVTIVGVELTVRSVGLADLEFRPPVSIVMGSESRGIQPQVLELCHHVIALPQLGMGNSINAGSAAAVVGFWALAVIGRQAQTGMKP